MRERGGSRRKSNLLLYIPGLCSGGTSHAAVLPETPSYQGAVQCSAPHLQAKELERAKGEFQQAQTQPAPVAGSGLAAFTSLGNARLHHSCFDFHASTTSF